THAFYTDVNADKAKYLEDGTKRRLTLIDEKLDEITLHSVAFHEVAKLLELAPYRRWGEKGVEALAALHEFMANTDPLKGPKIETKIKDAELLDKLEWFTSYEAETLSKPTTDDIDVEGAALAAKTIGFAKLFAQGFGFVTRGSALRFTAW